MYKEMYQVPELKVDITFSKFLVICITLFATLVIPIQIHLYVTNQQVDTVLASQSRAEVSTDGTVAGAYTVREETVSVAGITIDKKAAPYFIAAFMFLGVSALVMILIVLSSNTNNHYKEAYEFDALMNN